ncbi:hoxN [Symbiodinium microadriaticum]|nr:hoxN [Symbiodinium microadriaticum]
MTSHQPKVGPRLKISVPNFKRTDFSGEIEKLGGLHSGSSRKIRSVPRSDPDPSANRLKASAGFLSARAQEGYPDRAPEAGAGDFNAWLRSLAPPKEPTSPSGADGREFLPPKDEEDATAGLPLEAFDSPMDFEVHTPQEWLALCKQGPSAGKPQAAVLHYAAQEWRMLPCWVLGYEAASSRYIVELEDGSRKQVKRLALRFNEEDAQNFALRVETCRAKKAHCELQQAFIRFIESQPDELVSSMLRDQKERFIRQGLHGSHLEDAGSFVSQIRDLIREIEENYVLSMKFAKVKNDLILEMGTPYACVRDDTPFAPLLTSFLPTVPPQFGLVAHQAAEERVLEIAAQLVKQPTISRNVNVASPGESVWHDTAEDPCTGRGSTLIHRISGANLPSGDAMAVPVAGCDPAAHPRVVWNFDVGTGIGGFRFFALGHSLVVLLACCGILLTKSFMKNMLSTFHAYGSVFGLAISSTFLLALGILNLYTARQLWMEWKGRGGGHDATMGLWLRCCPRLFQAISKPWHMLIVGFLFGLGFDTSTEVGLLGVVAVSHGLAAPICILLLPLLFMSGMCLLDTLNGLMMAWIYRTSVEDDKKKIYFNLFVTVTSGLVAILVGLIEMLGFLAERANLQSWFFQWIQSANDHSELLGAGVVLIFLVAMAIALFCFRRVFGESTDLVAIPVCKAQVAAWLKENGATCKQVLRLLLGTWMALCGGSLYAFSRFEVQIMTRCSLTAQQLDVVYAAGQAGVGLGIVPGTLFDLYGPVETSLYGAAFTAAGNLGLASMLSGDQCGGVSSLATWYFLVQQGSVAIFQAGLFTNIVEAPPKMQGIITGIVSSGYGLSAAFVTFLFAFFQEDLDAYFKGTALLFSATGLVAACTMPLLRGGSRATAYGRLEHKDEAGGRSPPPATTYGRQEQEELPEAAPAPASSSPSLSRRDILCRADFWLFLLPFVLVQSIGSGLYIANLSLIGDSLGISPDSRPVYVRAVSYCNSLGRIFSGLAMDTLEPRGIHRSDHLLLSAFAVILASVALFLLPEEIVPAMLLPALAVIAAAYGSNWAIMPSYISKRFYGSHVGVMFNIHSGHIAVAVLVTSYAVGGLYDAQAELQGEGSFCHGTTCWRPAFGMGLIVQAVALAVALLLMWKVRRPQISESKAASEKTCHEK